MGDILTLDEMTALGVKRGRPSVTDPKIIAGLKGLKIGQAKKLDDIFGKTADAAERNKIRTQIRKHFPIAYAGEKPTIRWTNDGIPMVGRSGEKLDAE